MGHDDLCTWTCLQGTAGEQDSFPLEYGYDGWRYGDSSTDRMAWFMGIFDAALLRLLRIFPDGDWTWTYPWIQIPDKLQEPILCHFLHGFLAQMAYHTQQMVPGICLYPTGWKPQRAETYDSQYIYRVVTHRPVAWRGLELYYMGHVLLRAADRREVIFIGQAGTACDLIPYLYADRDSGFLDNLQHFRSANARKLYQAVIFPSSQGIDQN